jgi:hypothetical protein
MLEAFVRGDDRSAAYANKVEGFLIEHFYDDDEFQGLLTALASYSPGGGDLLYDEEGMIKVMEGTLNSLRRDLGT